MNIRFLRNIFLKNLGLLVVILLFSGGIATFVNVTSPEIYESGSYVFVSTPASGLDISTLLVGSTFSESRVKSYAEIMTSPNTLQPVIDLLKLNITPQVLAKNVRTVAPIDTVLLQIFVRDGNPVKSATIANAIARQFAKTAAALEISPETGVSQVRVTPVKDAVPSQKPIEPKKRVNYGLSLVFSFVSVLLVGFLRELFDSTVKNDDDVPSDLLGVIDFDPTAKFSPVLGDGNSYSSRNEAMRQIRTNILEKSELNSIQVINVTSSISGEGKSTFCINLAETLTKTGLKVCLVEGDLRRPSISKYLNYKQPIAGSKSGLATILEDNSSISLKRQLNLIIERKSQISFDFISAGPPPQNPAELLLTDKMFQIIKLLRTEYDFVIIDSPPTLPVTDSRLINKFSDGVVILAKAGVVKKRQLATTLSFHQQVGASVIGFCINMAPIKDPAQEYGYRSSKHNYENNGALKYYYSYYRNGPEDQPYAPLDMRYAGTTHFKDFLRRLFK